MSVRCPACNCSHCPVSHTITREVRFRGKDRTSVRRRRVCRHCSTSFHTLEYDESDLQGDESEPEAPSEGRENPFLPEKDPSDPLP